MDELDISFIRIVFENSESLDIGIDNVVRLEIGDIDKIIEGWGREVRQLSIARNVSIVINESVNHVEGGFSFDLLQGEKKKEEYEKVTLLNRLSKKRGIASIELHSEECVLDRYLVSWSNEHNTVNKDVRYDFNSKGDLMVTINKESDINQKIADIFYDGLYLEMFKKRSE